MCVAIWPGTEVSRLLRDPRHTIAKSKLQGVDENVAVATAILRMAEGAHDRMRHVSFSLPLTESDRANLKVELAASNLITHALVIAKQLGRRGRLGINARAEIDPALSFEKSVRSKIASVFASDKAAGRSLLPDIKRIVGRVWTWLVSAVRFVFGKRERKSGSTKVPSRRPESSRRSPSKSQPRERSEPTPQLSVYLIISAAVVLFIVVIIVIAAFRRRRQMQAPPPYSMHTQYVSGNPCTAS